jgi:SAM-dependent methyltransferase
VSPIRSSFSSVIFELDVCESCEMGLVMNPRTDFSQLYGPEYYEGRGADPLIDYVGDEVAGSAREIEWNGIVQTVRDIDKVRRGMKEPLMLLDWGAGLGGLVRAARQHGLQADGLDEGHASKVLETKGLIAPPMAGIVEHYDIVTAIEVVKHLLDPISEIRSMATCLKPGGFLFITTGNFAKARGPLNTWYYAQVPDVHITFWSPRSWSKALRSVDLDPVRLPLRRVDPRIVQYKVIRALPKYRAPLMAPRPLWSGMTRVLDRRYGVSEFAIGVKPST